jgi:hypothetical protein
LTLFLNNRTFHHSPPQRRPVVPLRLPPLPSIVGYNCRGSKCCGPTRVATHRRPARLPVDQSCPNKRVWFFPFFFVFLYCACYVAEVDDVSIGIICGWFLFYSYCSVLASLFKFVTYLLYFAVINSQLGKLNPKAKDDPVSKMQRYREQWKKDTFLQPTMSKKTFDAVLDVRARMKNKPVPPKKTHPTVPHNYEACPKRRVQEVGMEGPFFLFFSLLFGSKFSNNFRCPICLMSFHALCVCSLAYIPVWQVKF